MTIKKHLVAQGIRFHIINDIISLKVFICATYCIYQAFKVYFERHTLAITKVQLSLASLSRIYEIKN